MRNEIEAMITDITATTAEAEDYTGEDGLLYCGKCHTPKEAYFSKETAQWLGHDRHPAECDCQRAAREKREAAESRQKHLEKVEDLKRRGFTDPAMRNWTFEHDNGRNPQTETARFYVESWETMQAENIGYLFWGGVGKGKSYLAACIANALMEKEVAVCMTNFATIAQPTEQQQALVQELSKRAALVHSGSVDPARDNMLKITSDGRKLGLDQRIINPDLPDDPGSKVNLCVSNIRRIWEDGQADKLTQLVFCDISTPKGRSAPERIAAKSPAGNLDSPELHALESLVPESEAEPQFSVYEDIRSKLIAQGIPAEQIAFIHDANTEARKKELFAKVRTGQVRVLIGSTFKMGAGMNVQDRLIALHDLDCPWRPGDLEQRSGRIIRQGNMNPEVHIYRYVTEGTFDSFLWQTVETKQKFISQIMTSKSPVRSCEDVDETALSYAEIKALCAGDPRIREKMDLDIDVARLKLLKADHQSQQFRLEDNLLKHFPEQIERSKGFIAGFQADMETLAAHPHPKDGFAGMEIRGDRLTDKENAGAALLDAMKDATGLDPVPIGSYRGFAMSLTLEDFGKDYVLTLKGQMTHRVTLGKDARGNLTRIDNVLNQMPERLKNVEAQLQTLYAQVEAAKAELGKPFPQEAELRQKSEHLAELNTLLDMDGKGSQERTAGESAVAKSSRPSVLEKLRSMSATEPPHSTQNHHRTEEIR